MIELHGGTHPRDLTSIMVDPCETRIAFSPARGTRRGMRKRRWRKLETNEWMKRATVFAALVKSLVELVRLFR